MHLPKVELVAPTFQRPKFASIWRMLVEGVIWCDYRQDFRFTGPILRNVFTLCDISYTSPCKNMASAQMPPRVDIWLLPKCPDDPLQHYSCPPIRNCDSSVSGLVVVREWLQNYIWKCITNVIESKHISDNWPNESKILPIVLNGALLLDEARPFLFIAKVEP